MTRNPGRASGREENGPTMLYHPSAMGWAVGHGVTVAVPALLQAGDKEENGDKGTGRADKNDHTWDLHRA